MEILISHQLPLRQALRDFADKRFSHDSEEGREAYRRESEDIDNGDLVKDLRKKVLEFKEHLYERSNEKYRQPWDFDFFPKALDQKARDTLEQEVEETKKQFVESCKRDDLEEFSRLLIPRWRHLALNLLGTAVQYEAPQITARMLNEFLYLIPPTEGFCGLEKTPGKHHYLHQVLEPLEFGHRALPYLDLQTIRFFLVDGGFFLWKFSSLETPAKAQMVNKFSLQELHESRDGYGNSMLGALLKYLKKEDRVWVERVRSALSWLSPDDSFPYGVELSRDAVFPFYEDLIDLNWFVMPSPIRKVSWYEAFSYDETNLPRTKLEARLKRQGLI